MPSACFLRLPVSLEGGVVGKGRADCREKFDAEETMEAGLVRAGLVRTAGEGDAGSEEGWRLFSSGAVLLSSLMVISGCY